MEAYWNHNSAYHRRILKVAGRLSGSVLDIGCGEGLLAERLAAVSACVTAVDSDEAALALASERTKAIGNVKLIHADFLTMSASPASYDLVIFVASLHHMDLPGALSKAKDLLRPGGELFVVGLSANRTLGDHLLSAAVFPLVRIMSAVHRERRGLGVVTTVPTERLSDIRTLSVAILPGAHLRRLLYYRYMLQWTKPTC